MATAELVLSVPQREYQLALNSQGACNLSGVVKDWARVLDLIWEEARANRDGTDFVNEHPICVLFAEQVGYLARASANYFQASEACRQRAGV